MTRNQSSRGAKRRSDPFLTGVEIASAQIASQRHYVMSFEKEMRLTLWSYSQ
jgi:hypothetical protein